MEIQEIINLVDELIVSVSDNEKHLNDVEKEILLGCYEGKEYLQIATENNRAETYVKESGRKLWEKLSKALSEKVSKANFKTTLERFYNYKSNKDLIIINQTDSKNNQVNLCPNTPNIPDILAPPNKPNNYQNQVLQASFFEDLKEAPEITKFYGYAEELITIEKHIIEDKCRLISLFGVSGIGKSSLTRQLVEKIKSHFNYVIWKSLNTLPTLTEILTDILQFISPNKENNFDIPNHKQLSLLKSYLMQNRCLIIFDDFQFIFCKQKTAGIYQQGYEDYQNFLKIIAEITHQSCLILLSSEQSTQIIQLQETNSFCRSLILSGLGENSKEIFRNKGLLHEDKWDNLINIYSGNPLYLSIIANMIKDLLAGNVSEFLNYDQPFFDDEIQLILQQQIERLSLPEMEILKFIVTQNNPVSLTEIQEYFSNFNTVKIPANQVLISIKSLTRRSHLKLEVKNQVIYVYILPILKEYLTN